LEAIGGCETPGLEEGIAVNLNVNETPPESPAWPRLVADIGGSNARFGWIRAVGHAIEHVRTLSVAAHASPVEAARAYLQDCAAQLGAAYRPPRHAAFAVATAVQDDCIEFTNSNWRFSRQAALAALGLQSLLVLNDFEALALSVPGLKASQLRGFGPPAAAEGCCAVIGPGTGLGVATVLQTRQGWVAMAGEGGHATLAPTNALESDILAAVRTRYEHVSAERLLSGIGLPELHWAVNTVQARPTEPVRTEDIVQRGLRGDDPSCSQTLDIFCAMLGSFAGSVALTVGARGGVYIGGGIVPRLGDRFFSSQFRASFVAKGRFRAYLEGIPCAVILDTLAALEGAAYAVEQSLN